MPVELLSDCRDPSSLARGLCAHLKSPASLPNSLHSPVLPFPTGPRGSDGHAGGFVEWGKAGKPPLTYLADGWARQRESVAPPITVFELALHYVEVPGSQGPTPARGRLTPLTVRVVVDETTGDATLTRRRVLIALLTFPLLLPPYIKVWALRGDRHIDQRAGAPRPPICRRGKDLAGSPSSSTS